MTQTPPLIGGRYEIKKKLGAGAMGAVYLALDRLTNQTIAIKRVLLVDESTYTRGQTTWSPPPTNIHTNLVVEDQTIWQDSTPTVVDNQTPIPRVEPDPERRRILLKAIASEFQMLASLRHPHIISVLDYGFDHESPYFTMSYLDRPQTILKATENLSTVEQVKLLQQMLEALTYLHRQGILHHDLKPDNVLVSEGVVKVLDFGLASAKGSEVGGGTLFYMAPEVFQRGDITEGVDLYAVGVMVYEMFAGKLPFESGPMFIMDVLTERPDLSAMNVGIELQEVVGKLLEKDPRDRYATAYEAMVAFSEAVAIPVPHEDEAVRESFLQAAQFVGRDAEMEQLLAALDESLQGKGVAWLVAGNSGVGKSRLVRELRTQALVKGVLVITGQGIRDGALPYQIWREPLRRLVLLSDLTDTQAGVLKQLIPDLPRLLKRDIPDPPELDSEAAQQRFMSVITTILQKQTHPLFLLLEDLQWAGEESLAVLQQLLRVMDHTQLFVVGSYRPEESPNLPAQLPQAQLLHLQPLTSDAMISLSVSILGKAGEQPEILEFLERETEGNAFFLVEVVRTLAEEVGRLSQIGEVVLPETIFPDGIRTIIQRRLQTIPAWAHPLLRLVAIAGRQLDHQLLPQLDPDLDIEAWLTVCAQRAVLEREENQWQLSHDKIRDGILLELTSTERIPLHQQVAEAMEQVYPNDPEHAAILTYHWHEAQQPDKERYYAQQAGEHAENQYAHEEAITYLTRALDLTPTADIQAQVDLLLAREKIHNHRGQREEQIENLNQLQQLVSTLKNDTYQGEVYLRQASYAHHTDDLPTAITYSQMTLQQTSNILKQAEAYYRWGSVLLSQHEFELAINPLKKGLNLARQANDEVLVLYYLILLGRTNLSQNDYESAERYFTQVMQRGKTIHEPLLEIEGLFWLGRLRDLQKNYDQAETYYQQGLQICQQIGHRLKEVNILDRLASIFVRLKHYERARDNFDKILAICTQIDDQVGICTALGNLGWLNWLLGHYIRALYFLEQSLIIVKRPHLKVTLLANLGHVKRDMGQPQLAQNYYQQALDIARKIDSRSAWYALNGLGLVHSDLGDYDQATHYYEEALKLRDRPQDKAMLIEDLAGLAWIAFQQGKNELAQTHLTQIRQYLVKNPMLIGAERPLYVYYVCLQILQKLTPSEVENLLLIAYELLESQGKLLSADNKRTFFTNIPYHRSIIQMVQSLL